ncbi:MAG: hypothetical protein ACTSU0_12835 [Alphaproteobacteria bacterium]
MSAGLMAFWADFDEDDISAVRQWHNCEHMSERVNLPGFRAGRRYRGFGDASTFLMYYETQTPEVLASAPYQQALNSPTEWTKVALKLFREPARAVFRLIDDAGTVPDEPAFFLATTRFNITGDVAAVLAEYRRNTLPALARLDAVVRVRLWENQEGISGIQTEESSIYGDGPGRQRFALFVETKLKPEPITVASLPGLSEIARATHTSEICEVGWLDFALR